MMKEIRREQVMAVMTMMQGMMQTVFSKLMSIFDHSDNEEEEDDEEDEDDGEETTKGKSRSAK